MIESGGGVLPPVLSCGEPPYDIQVELIFAGGDMAAVVTGGTRPHIGAVALAEPAGAAHPVTGIQGQLAELSVSTITGYGHRDAVIAEMFAGRLCEKYGVNVCAAAGVHIDGAGPEEIAKLMENAKALLAQLE